MLKIETSKVVYPYLFIPIDLLHIKDHGCLLFFGTVNVGHVVRYSIKTERLGICQQKSIKNKHFLRDNSYLTKT